MSSLLDPDHPLTALRYLKTLCPQEDLSSRILQGFFDTSGVPHDGISCAAVSIPSRDITLHDYIALTDGLSCECGFYRGTPTGQALGAVCSMCNITRLASLSVALSSWPEAYRLSMIAKDAPLVLASHIGSPWVADFIDIFDASSATLISNSVSSLDKTLLFDAIRAHSHTFSVSLGSSQDFHNWSELVVSSLFDMRDLDALSRRHTIYQPFYQDLGSISEDLDCVVFSTRHLVSSSIKRRPRGLIFLLSTLHKSAVSGAVVSAALPSDVVRGLDVLFGHESFYARTQGLLSQPQLDVLSSLWSPNPSDPLHQLSAAVSVAERLA